MHGTGRRSSLLPSLRGDSLPQIEQFMTSPPITGYGYYNPKPIVFAIVGKSASGKDYLAKTLAREISAIKPIVSWTTRPKREGEQQGVDYRFVSRKKFEKARQKGEFIEWSEFNGWYYGTPHDAIGHDLAYVGVFNLDGLYSLMKHQDAYQVIPVYMDAPWLVRLKRSVKREGKLTPEMVRRMFADHQDFANGRYNDIKRLGRAVSLSFDYRFMEEHPDVVVSTVWSYIRLLLENYRLGNPE